MGAALTLIGAVAYALHIIATARFVTPQNAMQLTLVQTTVVAAACIAFAAPGGLSMPTSLDAWLPLLYLAVVAGAATLFLQNWAQAYVEPTKAAVIMCSEPVWAAVFAVAVGGEALTWQMVVGGLSILVAMYLVAGRLPSIDRLRSIVVRRGSNHRRNRLGRSWWAWLRNRPSGGASSLHQGVGGVRLDIR